MLETALVFDTNGRTLHWHEPPGRSGGWLPDSRGLWDVLWEHRQKGGSGRLQGVAHTHPWNGPAHPSGTDVTTFRAVELGLGQLLVWPIVTFTDIRFYVWHPGGERYVEWEGVLLEGLDELRERSRG
jgi:hypothetical protein